jgi:hypothetical protein
MRFFFGIGLFSARFGFRFQLVKNAPQFRIV